MVLTGSEIGLLDRTRRIVDAELRAAARGRLVVPLLVMGACERVGSNWFTSRLRPNVSVYNEPFRQQLHPSHEMSPYNARASSGCGVRSPLEGFGAHWLAAFVLSKYGTRPVVLKETSLFFSVAAYMGLFPRSDVVLLGRDIVGVASSFIAGNLFERWEYGGRYEEVAGQAGRCEGGRWECVMPSGGRLRDLEKLVRLIFLNTALLVEATECRRQEVIAYEEASATASTSWHAMTSPAPAATWA